MANKTKLTDLVVVGSTKSSTEAWLFFFGVDAIVCTLFIFHAMLDHTKKEDAVITQIATCYLLAEPNPLHLTFAISFG